MLMRFKGTADGRNAIGAIKLRDGSFLKVGGHAEIDDDDAALMSSRGIVLEAVEEEMREESFEDLKTRANELGADITGARSKESILERIKAHLEHDDNDHDDDTATT